MRLLKPVRRISFAIALLSAVIFASATPAGAKVKRIVIDKAKSESPTYGGKSFGKADNTRKIVGRASASSTQKIPTIRSSRIFSLHREIRAGMVEYVATFTLVKPVDMAKANNVLLYEVVNRGRKLEPGGSDRGYTYLWSGWQVDIPEGSNAGGQEPERIEVAVAKTPMALQSQAVRWFASRTPAAAQLLYSFIPAVSLSAGYA